MQSPSFSGEPRDDADRAWHAGPGYRDILPLFDQAAQRLNEDGTMYLLISSDTNRRLIDHLINSAALEAKEVARRSIWLEAFHIFELRQRLQLSAPALEPDQLFPTTVFRPANLGQ